MEKLPLTIDIETKKILKQVASSNRSLAELKGLAKTIPNPLILINTLSIREAKDSSEIENIVTTNDEIFKAEISSTFLSSETKEVRNYYNALKVGFELVKKNELLTTNIIIQIQGELENNNAGIRKQSGTVLKNSKGEVVYSPPQNYDEVIELLNNLEKYINDFEDEVDPLIKMAIIHHQFESIHPFYDGNGRTGRIINILYLILNGMLNTPILYLSSYIIKNKNDYYRLLQEVRTNNSWEEWIIYILKGVEETSEEAIILINNINKVIDETKLILKEKESKIYSKDLLEILFLHPYTKIDFLVNKLGIARQTATIYLDKIEKLGILEKVKNGRSVYYINKKLLELLS